MCWESRNIFTCGCEKPQDDEWGVPTCLILCEFAQLGRIPCNGLMIAAHPDSRRLPWLCLECEDKTGQELKEKPGVVGKLRKWAERGRSALAKHRGS